MQRGSEQTSGPYGQVEGLPALLLVCGEERCTNSRYIGVEEADVWWVPRSHATTRVRAIYRRGQLLTEFSCSPKSPVPPLSLATECGIADAAALWSDGVGLRVRWQMHDAACARLTEWGGWTAGAAGPVFRSMKDVVVGVHNSAVTKPNRPRVTTFH